MVKGLLAFMTREIRGLHEAAYLLALFTLLSQILALVRARAFAHFFGAGPTLDAYFAAFRVPDTVFAILTLFVSAYALVPMIAERGGVGSRSARSLIGSVLIVFGIAASIIAVVLYACAPLIIPRLFPGFSDPVIAQVVLLSRIMLVQPILLGLSSIVAAIVQASRQFFLYALAPIFYNLGIIAGVLFLYPAFGIVGLAWGVVLGAVMHLVVQLIPLAVSGGASFPLFTLESVDEVWHTARLSLPRSLALAANQILLLAFASVATLVAAGAVSVVQFAYNLQSVILSVIGVSYASALFPALSQLFSNNEHERFRDETWAGLRHVAFWTLPAVTFIVVLRAHIVRIILGSGAFDWNDTRLTAAVLAAFALSLVAQSALLIFSRAYYAAHKSWAPIVINVFAALTAGILALVGVQWFKTAGIARTFVEELFRLSGVPGTDVLMIPLAYSVVYLVAGLIFAILFARTFGYDKRVTQTIASSLTASLVGAAACYSVLQITGPELPTKTFFGILAQGALGGVVGTLVWGFMLRFLKSVELAETVSIVAAKFKKKTI